ncbi:hypothetical protein KKF55_00850 [Patescibacteria group bacterium]|nr:hypothetical protein [Patescibacteria group bacterium]
MKSKSDCDIWYVVRNKFYPHTTEPTGIANVILSQGCLLKAEGGTSFRAENGKHVPRKLLILDVRQQIDCVQTFEYQRDKSFADCCWGPYRGIVAAKPLWIFRGSLDPSNKKNPPKLKGVGRHGEIVLTGDQCRQIAKDCWEATLGKAIMIAKDGKFILAPTDDLREVLVEE